MKELYQNVNDTTLFIVNLLYYATSAWWSLFNDLNSLNIKTNVITTEKKSAQAPAAQTPSNPINKGNIKVNGINKITCLSKLTNIETLALPTDWK